MTDALLKINGKLYGGWTSLEVQRSVDHIAGSFTFTAAELWSGKSAVRNIPPGAACSVVMGDATVITGYVDGVDVSYDAQSHHVTVTGRDAAGDLVDSSAVHTSGYWNDQTMDKIVADLIQPHGIKMSVSADVGRPFLSWQITRGETVWENIERMARQRGVLVRSDGLGGIVLEQPSTQRVGTALVRGKNIKAAQSANNVAQRFRTYVVIGQAELLDPESYDAAIASNASATDSVIRPNRVLIIPAEEAFDTATYQKRAQWEAATHYGRGLNLAITVRGWSHKDGLWEPDCMVRVDDDFLDIHDWLYICSVTYRLSENGTTSVLGITRREAFETIAIPTKGDLGSA